MSVSTSGKVIFVSRNGAMIVVRHDNGYALVELLGDEGLVELGERVSGDFSAEGSEPLSTPHGRLDTVFQGSWGVKEIPVQMAKQSGGG